MFCSNCGKQIPDGSAFCPECGATLGGAQAAPAQGQAMQNFQQGFNNFQNAVKGADYSDAFNMNRTGNKMNFVGFGAALLMLIFLFLPVVSVSIDASFLGTFKFKNSLFQIGAMGIITAIILILVVCATAFFSFIKMDTPVLIAGIVATVFMFILTIIIICKGFNVTIELMGMKDSGPVKDITDEGGKVGITFGFIMLWISSLATAFAGICRKFIPALR